MFNFLKKNKPKPQPQAKTKPKKKMIIMKIVIDNCLFCSGRGRVGFTSHPCSDCDATGKRHKLVTIDGD